MRPVKCAMCEDPTEAAKALLFKGKSAGLLDSVIARGRQVGQAAPEPDSRRRSGHLVGSLGRPPASP